TPTGAEGEVQERAGVDRREVEGRDSDGHVVKGPSQGKVAVLLPAGDDGHDRSALAPLLEQHPTEPWIEGQPDRVRVNERMTPPAAGILGQRGENVRRGAPDLDVKREIDRQLRPAHRLALSLDLARQPQQSRCPRGCARVEPALVQALEWDRVEVVPALPATLAAGDQARLREHVQVAHDRDPGNLEMGSDLAGDPRPL